MNTIKLNMHLKVEDILARLNICIPEDIILDPQLYSALLDSKSSKIDIFRSVTCSDTALVDIHISRYSEAINMIMLYREYGVVEFDVCREANNIIYSYYCTHDNLFRIRLNISGNDDILKITNL